MPAIVYETLDAIPEELREGAAKGADGKFTVNVVLKARLDEFREKNISVSKEKEALEATLAEVKPFIGEDPKAFAARIKELEGIATQVKDGKLQGTDAITQEVENRVKAMKADFDRQLSEKAQEAAREKQTSQTWEHRYQKTLIDNAVTDAVISPASGALAEALPDILERANKVFKVVDGKIVAMDGTAIRYGADGVSSMTPAEWLVDLRKKAGYLFKGSSGGGANGGSATDKNSATLGLSPEKFAALTPEAKLARVHELKLTHKSASYRG